MSGLAPRRGVTARAARLALLLLGLAVVAGCASSASPPPAPSAAPAPPPATVGPAAPAPPPPPAPTPSMRRIAVLGEVSPGTRPVVGRAFELALRERGYVPGSSIAIEYAWTDGSRQAYQREAARIIATAPDVIVTAGNLAVGIAKQMTRTIPIVMATMAGDPVAQGFVASLQKPGGNVTGVADIHHRVRLEGDALVVEDAARTMIDLLKETIPSLARVAVVMNPDNRFNTGLVNDLQARGREIGVSVIAAPVTREQDFSAVVNKLKPSVQALIVAPDRLFYFNRRPLADAIRTARFPAIAADLSFVLEGGLLGYSIETAENFRLAADFVDRILKGARPADLPINSSVGFQLWANLRTARELGLTIPPSVLQKARRRVE